jgi:hypothetical protein
MARKRTDAVRPVLGLGAFLPCPLTQTIIFLRSKRDSVDDITCTPVPRRSADRLAFGRFGSAGSKEKYQATKCCIRIGHVICVVTMQGANIAWDDIITRGYFMELHK